MIARIKRAHDRLIGYRTLIVAVLLAVIDTLSVTDLAPIIPPSWMPYWLTLHPVIFAVLRIVTTGPVGGTAP